MKYNKHKNMQTKTNYPFLLPILLFIAPIFGAAQNEADWELKRDKDGVKVYMREVEGSKIKEMRFETEIEASLNAITAILMDIDGFDNWVYASMGSEVIEEISETEVYYYTQIDFPWPMSNRDLVLYSRFWQDPKTLAIRSETYSVHDMKPEDDDFVRIKKADLFWTFTPIDHKRVKVEYYLNSDPGGNIPAWLINIAADQGPYLTMVKFKEEIEKDKYKNADLSFVREYGEMNDMKLSVDK